MGKIKRDLDKRLNDLVSCQYLKIREKTSLKVDYFDLTIYVDNMGCWPRFWKMKKIEGVEVTRDRDGEKEVLYDQTDEGKKVSEGIPIEFTDDEYCYKLTFGLIEIGVVEHDQAQIKINREKKVTIQRKYFRI
ncbi:MAG: hypothetical protein AYP45_15635 [Candidatus Brocadia carolinensis]|uniref:Uncharacterized protein n=1 Tax=Candidatus Brocadia carolinensis TaxID=1004156 RepID=A0A1V4AQA1_9BACT|nr:MAG: hypothetical protein AYP45_15635 [Candidatus Brocadia caroliniensis]